MSKLQDKYRDVLSAIDAIKTTLEEMADGKSLSSLNFKINKVNFDPTLNASVSINPFDFLVAILQKFVTYDEIVEWLSNMLVNELPAIELGVKGVLLSQLKKSIDCTNDPRIPEKFRKKLNPLPSSLKKQEEMEYSDNRGAVIPIGNIDVSNMMYYCPVNEYGQEYYFGTRKYYALEDRDGNELQKWYSYAEAAKSASGMGYSVYEIVDKSEVDTVWELARAEDFNAFLWFAMHKAKFVNPIVVTFDQTASIGASGEQATRQDILLANDLSEQTLGSGALPFSGIGTGHNVLECLYGSQTVTITKTKAMIPGNTIIQASGDCNSNVLGLCIKAKEKTHGDSDYGSKIASEGFKYSDVTIGSNFAFDEKGSLSGDPCYDSVTEKYYFRSGGTVYDSETHEKIIINVINKATFYFYDYYKDGKKMVRYKVKGYCGSIEGAEYDYDSDDIEFDNFQVESAKTYFTDMSYELNIYNTYAKLYNEKTGRDLKTDQDTWCSMSTDEQIEAMLNGEMEAKAKEMQEEITSKIKKSFESKVKSGITSGFCAESAVKNLYESLENGNLLKESTMADAVALGIANKDYSFQVVPVSCDYNSVNWYVDRSRYFDFLKKESKRKERDYTNEFALCNIKYENTEGYSSSYVSTTNGSFRVTVLPRPFWHMPQLEDGNVLPKRILFDHFGKPTSKGKYTVSVKSSVPRKIYETYEVTKKGQKVTKTRVIRYEYDVVNGGNVVNTLCVDPSLGGEYKLTDLTPYAVAISLNECYPGATIYEFNYDFVMGMKLFDAQTVANKLILSLCNFEMGIDLDVNRSDSTYQMRVSSIVKKMVENTSSEVSDCFFTFSNDEYNTLLEESENRRSHLYSFKDSDSRSGVVNGEKIMNILKGCNDNATLHEQQQVITQAINEATASVTNEVSDTDKYSLKCNFVLEMVKAFASILVECVLTPKVMMIVEFDKALMGEEAEEGSIDEILKSIIGLITAIVKEIVDIVMQMILELVIKKLGELLLRISEAIVAEQLDAYLKIIRDLAENCVVIPHISLPTNLDTELDNVQYADIDAAETVQTDECNK